jgi:hypothetical protein
VKNSGEIKITGVLDGKTKLEVSSGEYEFKTTL